MAAREKDRSSGRDQAPWLPPRLMVELMLPRALPPNHLPPKLPSPAVNPALTGPVPLLLRLSSETEAMLISLCRRDSIGDADACEAAATCERSA